MNWQVQVGDETTSAAVDLAPNGDRSTVFVCAHGAGGNMTDNGVRTVSRTLGERGVDVVRFNFLYKEKKSGRPDPMPRLQATTAAVAGIGFAGRYWFLVRMDAVRRTMSADDAPAIRKFRRLHIAGMLANFVMLVTFVFGMTRVSL